MKFFQPTLNPSTCPCHGKGRFLSDRDAWVVCPTHKVPSQGHPEERSVLVDAMDDMDAAERADAVARLAALDARIDEERLALHRRIYAQFRAAARECGFEGSFWEACQYHLPCGRLFDPSSQDWIDAAESVAREFADAAEARQAEADGFRSVLEARLAHETVLEERERAAQG